MPRRLTKDALAESDLVDIVSLIASEQPDAAMRFIDHFEDHCGQLLTHPHMGTPQEFALAGEIDLRRIPVRGFTNFGIFYKITATELRIVRVLHGASIRR